MANDMVQLMYVSSLPNSTYTSPPPSRRPVPTTRITRAQSELITREKEGFSSFSIAGHDRGGRVAHRLTLDYPDKVKRLMVLDIAPTLFAFENMGHKSVSAMDGRSESRNGLPSVQSDCWSSEAMKI
jgi:pimeloyl-ACP methyl ester carboxylesterase